MTEFHKQCLQTIQLAFEFQEKFPTGLPTVTFFYHQNGDYLSLGTGQEDGENQKSNWYNVKAADELWRTQFRRMRCIIRGLFYEREEQDNEKLPSEDGTCGFDCP